MENKSKIKEDQQINNNMNSSQLKKNKKQKSLKKQTEKEIQDFYNLHDIQELVSISLNKKKAKQIHEWELSLISKKDQKKYAQTKKNNHQKYQQYAQKFPFEILLQEYKNPQNFDKTFKKIISEKMKKELIPDELRSRIWLTSTQISYIKTQIYPQNYIDTLKNLENIKDFFDDVIKQDVNRTLQINNHLDIQEQENQKHEIYQLLLLTSRRNPFIGYCQGMNFLALYLINKKDMSFQDKFWLFQQIIEQIIPLDYYTTMIGVLSDQEIFVQLLKKYNNQVHKKLDQLGLDSGIFTMQWFVCLFTQSLAPHVIDLVWDHMIINGSTVLFKIGLIIFDIAKQKILECQTFTDVILAVENTSKQLGNLKDINDKINQLYISKKVIQTCREEIRLKFKKKREQTLKKKIKQDKCKSWQQKECDERWPICHQILQKTRLYKRDIPLFIFKTAKKIKIEQNYFQQGKQIPPHKHNMSPERFQDQKNQSSLILIGRHHHICQKNLQNQESPNNNNKQSTEDEMCSSQLKQYKFEFIQYNEEELIQQQFTKSLPPEEIENFKQQSNLSDKTNNRYEKVRIFSDDNLDTKTTRQFQSFHNSMDMLEEVVKTNSLKQQQQKNFKRKQEKFKSTIHEDTKEDLDSLIIQKQKSSQLLTSYNQQQQQQFNENYSEEEEEKNDNIEELSQNNNSSSIITNSVVNTSYIAKQSISKLNAQQQKQLTKTATLMFMSNFQDDLQEIVEIYRGEKSRNTIKLQNSNSPRQNNNKNKNYSNSSIKNNIQNNQKQSFQKQYTENYTNNQIDNNNQKNEENEEEDVQNFSLLKQLKIQEEKQKYQYL